MSAIAEPPAGRARRLRRAGGPRAQPWRLAGAPAPQPPRDGVAVALVLIVVSALAAPLYAEHIAHTDPFASNINGTTTVDGKVVDVLAPNPSGLGSTPLGPTLERPYFSAPTRRAATSPPGCSTAAARR